MDELLDELCQCKTAFYKDFVCEQKTEEILKTEQMIWICPKCGFVFREALSQEDMMELKDNGLL